MTMPKGVREIKLKKGSMFEVRATAAGHAPLLERHPTKAEAEAARATYLARIAAGKSPINRRAEEITLSTAIADFRTAHETIVDGEVCSTMPTQEWYRLNMLDSDLGKFRMAWLKYKFIDAYIAQKLKEEVPPPKNKKKSHPLYDGDKVRLRAPASVRKLYYTLKKVAKWHAKQNEYSLPEGAFEDQKIPPGWGNERERRLEPGEEEKILESVKRMYVKQEEWRRLILWALESGMRAQELLLTEWKDINLEYNFIRIRKEIVKTNTHRQVPLSDKASLILREHLTTKLDDNDIIFWQWTNSNSLGHSFKRITVNAGMKNFTIHDLRHEAISRLFENTDLSVMEIAAISGHTDLKTLRRYTHLRPQLMAAKMNGKKGKEIAIPVDDYLAFLKWQEDQRAQGIFNKTNPSAKEL